MREDTGEQIGAQNKGSKIIYSANIYCLSTVLGPMLSTGVRDMNQPSALILGEWGRHMMIILKPYGGC